jgi:hypothetical protein
MLAKDTELGDTVLRSYAVMHNLQTNHSDSAIQATISGGSQLNFSVNIAKGGPKKMLYMELGVALSDFPEISTIPIQTRRTASRARTSTK